ncbi:hypothetical protein F5Y01DRAFT_319704 [Xylaria sp. FL0043]|nr:hypothetical protein F5Y01DRAFT_319704 [Xylaria sp. FL0043]
MVLLIKFATIEEMVTFRKPSTAKESVVWAPPMILGLGGPHDDDLLKRVRQPTIRQKAGRGTVEQPKVTWLSRPPNHGLHQLEKIIMEETSRCGQAYAWVMMGVHTQSTVMATRNGFMTARQMADDDPHITIRMGPDSNTCQLHGHLYIHMEGPTPADGEDDQRIATRLMTEDERNYVGGKPRHLWIWGPYGRESMFYPRSGITLPKPPFVRKPGR